MGDRAIGTDPKPCENRDSSKCQLGLYAWRDWEPAEDRTDNECSSKWIKVILAMSALTPEAPALAVRCPSSALPLLNCKLARANSSTASCSQRLKCKSSVAWRADRPVGPSPAARRLQTSDRAGPAYRQTHRRPAAGCPPRYTHRDSQGITCSGINPGRRHIASWHARIATLCLFYPMNAHNTAFSQSLDPQVASVAGRYRAADFGMIVLRTKSKTAQKKTGAVASKPTAWSPLAITTQRRSSVESFEKNSAAAAA